MPRAYFRFYEELNELLPPRRRKVTFDAAFGPRTSVKQAIESLGVPHTEVDLIVVNGASAGFDRPLADGDRVSVYPVFESFDVQATQRLRERPLRRPRFIADVHLGGLTRHLRLLGFDTLFDDGLVDAELARISAETGRILLTRDRDLLKRRIVTHGYYCRAIDPRAQAREVVERVQLQHLARPLTRCLRCNGPMRQASKADVTGRVPDGVLFEHESFYRCPGCHRVYWPGPRYRALLAEAADIVRPLSGRAP